MEMYIYKGRWDITSLPLYYKMRLASHSKMRPHLSKMGSASRQKRVRRGDEICVQEENARLRLTEKTKVVMTWSELT